MTTVSSARDYQSYRVAEPLSRDLLLNLPDGATVTGGAIGSGGATVCNMSMTSVFESLVVLVSEAAGEVVLLFDLLSPLI